MLTVPSHVHLRYVDLSIELQVLGFYRSRQDEPVQADDGRGRPGADLRSVGLSAPTDLV